MFLGIAKAHGALMGIVIVVRSITGVKPFRVGQAKYEWEYVTQMCEYFGWQKVPWEEPSAYKAINTTSANYSRYALLMDFAFNLEVHGTISVEPCDRPPNQLKRFRHLLDIGPDTNFYLPLEFDLPVHLVVHSDRAWPDFSVGSSIKLAEEMQDLKPVLAEAVVDKGAETVVVPRHPYHKWGAVLDLCDFFLRAARESVEVNLPLWIAY